MYALCFSQTTIIAMPDKKAVALSACPGRWKPMDIRPTSVANETPARVWMRKLVWALPVFFLIKGLAWLAIPVLFAIYGLD
jgi:hypothetical protein